MERLYSLSHPLLESQPLLLSIALVTIGVLFGSYYRFKISPSQAKRLPPGSLGLPFFGETIGFLRAQRHDRTQEWFESRSRKYGPMFKTSLIGKPTIVITGPAGNRFLFTANENTIASNPVRTITAIMGRYNIFELSGNEHKLIRGAMASFLKPEHLQRYVGKMDSVIKQQILQELTAKDSVRAVPFLKRITYNVTCSVLFALPPGKEQELMFEEFIAALKGMWALQVNLPLTRFHRAMVARRRILTYFSKLIQESKEGPVEGSNGYDDSVISRFINLKDENGKKISEEMIVDNMITLMIGSHDTSTIVLSQLMRLLARNKDIYEQVLEEQIRVLGEKEVWEKELTWDDIQKMKYTWRVAQEMMRIIPPVFGNFKTVIKDTSFSGFDIPKGWQVFWVSSGTHMDKNIFPEPEKFEPSRFEASSKSYPPYSYIPFGAGSRICPGSEFARIEILLVMHHLVTNYEWSELVPNEPITRDPMPYPAMGLPIRLQPTKKVQAICT